MTQRELNRKKLLLAIEEGEIYAYYKDEPNCGIVELLEKNLLRWLEYKSGVGVYKAFMTISYQMEMEQKKVAPFKLNYEILERSLWEEMRIENEINIKNYGINLL